MRRAFLAALSIATFTAVATVADAQPGPARRPIPRPPVKPEPNAPSSGSGSGSGSSFVRSHVGTDYAIKLIRSNDLDERIRGIQRFAAIGTSDAITQLVQQIESFPPLKGDSRALVELARALSRFTDQERARAGLLLVVNAPSQSLTGALPRPRASDPLSLEEGDPIARAELARQMAAIALARSGNDRALESLYGSARSSGASGANAAIVALSLFPPKDPGFFGTTGSSLSADAVRMLGRLGDLRALDVLHAASRSSDVGVRGSAIVALAELGDERAIGLARTAIAESDARLRAAAGEALVVLSAPERYKAVTALISDDATTAIGVRLAERVHHPEITKLLLGRATSHPDVELRLAAIRALGRSSDDGAAKALVVPQLLGDNNLQYHAALALARSPAPSAGPLCAALAAGNKRSLGVRAYLVRVLVRGDSERIGAADTVIDQMARSADGKDRALGAFARIVLGEASVSDYIADKDARVRRAAAMAVLHNPTKSAQRALVSAFLAEKDPSTRQVLAIGLYGGDPDDSITTTTLIDRAESGGADAALATFALARRADEDMARKVGQLLGSRDPVLRTHAARGLAIAPLPDATGRLANVYAYETDTDVRRALIGALAARTKDASAPLRKQTLEVAASLDPDGPVRQAAKRALDGVTAPFAAAANTEVVWLRVTAENGGPPPAGDPYVGSLVRSDGLAVPLAFDDEGYVLVPGVPPGDARLVLAPRLPPSR
jgi:HEAT repeat protein